MSVIVQPVAATTTNVSNNRPTFEKIKKKEMIFWKTTMQGTKIKKTRNNKKLQTKLLQ